MTVTELTHAYRKSDNVTPATGVVRFMPVQPIELADRSIVRDAVPVALDGAGEITVLLVATTDSLTPDALYEVQEYIDGDPAAPWRYYIQVPHNLGSPLDLRDCPTKGIAPAISVPVAGPQGVPGPVGPSGNIQVVADYTALRALTAGSYAHALVTGNSTTLTGVYGEFYWDHDSLAADDGGTVIKPGGLTSGQQGRWKRAQAAFGKQDVDLALLFDPQWFGALDKLGTTSGERTANTSAWVAAEAKATAAGGWLVSKGGHYEVNAGIKIRCDHDVSRAEILINDANGIAWQIGLDPDPVTHVVTNTTKLTCHVPKLTQQNKSVLGIWGTGIGLKLMNLQDTIIHCRDITNFGTGVRVSAKGNNTLLESTIVAGRTQDITLHLAMLNNCKVGVEANPEDAVSWCNTASYHRGHYYLSSAEGSGVISGSVAILIRNTNADFTRTNDLSGPGGSGPNHDTLPATSLIHPQALSHHVFHGPNLETSSAAGTAQREWLIDITGKDNEVKSARYEGLVKNGRFGNDASSAAQRTVIDGGNGVDSIAWTVTGAAEDNKVIGKNTIIYDGRPDITARSMMVFVNHGGGTAPILKALESATAGAAYSTDPTVMDDYGWQLSTEELQGKRGADAFDRLALFFRTGQIALGSGAAAADVLIDHATNRLDITGGVKASLGIVNPSATTNLKNWVRATPTFDFPSIAANGGKQDLTVAMTGAAFGDQVIAEPQSNLENGLVWNAFVSSADTITVRLTNMTPAAIDPGSRIWHVLWLDLT